MNIHKDLLNKVCVACEGGVQPFDHLKAEEYMSEVFGWVLSEDIKKIFKKYIFKDFKEAMTFVNHVADIAESEGHHPDIYIYYNKVTLDLTTHAINGLSENDFIVATKVDSVK